mmetsp:Transcript_28945/g.99789  ORF Transcript_28945/g.99789 Transcript_28945/m.99789 type:complete len:130 (-) Transcript_28945:26-415(-)
MVTKDMVKRTTCFGNAISKARGGLLKPRLFKSKGATKPWQWIFNQGGNSRKDMGNQTTFFHTKEPEKANREKVEQPRDFRPLGGWQDDCQEGLDLPNTFGTWVQRPNETQPCDLDRAKGEDAIRDCLGF